ncbi:restriction endonuclease subunit S [Neomicrococcus lactis]|uniref:restriction endonuclease subunit S n=1 Tax=Neomicrococcus lactis TaxID=732241 RepID=UPI002301D6F2|nr:restriction endonuclease subunit S [Neomicrococcus lactis]
MNGWRDTTIGGLGRVVTGITPPSKHPDWFGDDLPFVTPSDINFGNRRPRPERWLSQSGRDGLRTRVVPPGSSAFVCIGATIGKVCLVETEAITNQQINTVIPAPDTDSRFLYSLLRHVAPAVAQGASGAATPIINKSAFSAIPVRIPDLETQVRIGEVLGALDDLIENNRRRIEILEQMARSIYREWFLKFRYPGHENVPLVDSELGPIPEGWVESTCGSELDFIGGGTPSKKEPAYWSAGTVAWYTPSDLTKTGWRYASSSELNITEVGVAKSSARIFPAGSVLMTSRATLGVLAIATTEATTNQGFIVIRPDERWSSGFIYEWLDSNAGALAALGTGATFKEITKGSFKSFPFVVPAQSVLDAYRVATEPLEVQIRVLEQQVRSLSDLRDLLLPKLVTGQIDVSSLDLDTFIMEQVA